MVTPGKLFDLGALAKESTINVAPDRDPATSIPGMPPAFGQWLFPHVVSFSGTVGSVSRVYRPSDEAMRDAAENARLMRNDLTVMECVEGRQRAVALLNWHLEPENEKDPIQKEVATEVTKILERIPRFMQYRENLLHGTFFGKYGCLHRWRWRHIGNKWRVAPDAWRPVHGDKIVYRYEPDSHEWQDDQVGIRVGSHYAPGALVAGRWPVEKTAQVDLTNQGLAYFLRAHERSLIAIHKHAIEDGEYEVPFNAGRIHGVGIRSRIYWTWYQKQETLAWLMEYLERSAGGFEIWYYPQGNPTAKEEVYQAARDRLSLGRNVLLVPRSSTEPGQQPYDRIEPSMAGAEALKAIVVEYFGHQIKRYILGQTLTTEASNTGLGSNTADVHLATFYTIVKYDAQLLEETITTDLVGPILRYNFPWVSFALRFRIDTESDDAEAKMQAYQGAYNMGLKIKAQDIMDLIGASKPEPGDEILSMQSQQPPGMGGMPGMPGGPGAGGPPGPGEPPQDPADPNAPPEGPPGDGGEPSPEPPQMNGGPAPAVQPTPPVPVEKYDKSGGQGGGKWVTVGGRVEGDKQHAGGTPVKIDKAGTVVAGPPALKGQSLNDSSGETQGGQQASDKPQPAEASHAEQYQKLGTRAPKFKEWFGDWESDPANASKVVDASGEPQETHGTVPQTVYHGTTAEFEEFSKQKIGTVAIHAGKGFYFAENPEIARNFSVKYQSTQTGRVKVTGHVISAYLNARNPLDLDTEATEADIGRWADACVAIAGKAFERKEFLEESHQLMKFMRSKGKPYTTFQLWNSASKLLHAGKDQVNDVVAALGHDGLCHTASDNYGAVRAPSSDSPSFGRVWVVFEPNQIKATDNAGTFDPTDARMRYSRSNEFERLHPRDEDGKFATKASESTGDRDPHVTRSDIALEDRKADAGQASDGEKESEPKAKQADSQAATISGFDSGTVGSKFASPPLGNRMGFDVEIAAVDGDTATLKVHGSTVKVPRESLRQIRADLTGDMSYLREYGEASHPAIQAVVDGQAELLGKGDDSVAYRVGDKVVKASTVVPYQPQNPFYKTPEQAFDRAKEYLATAKAMKQAGVPGIPPTAVRQHGDKLFTVTPFYTVPEKWTEDQLRQIGEHMEAMHTAGYTLNDQIQMGVDESGQLWHIDLGKAVKSEDQRSHEWDVKNDEDQLEELYRRSDIRSPRSIAEMKAHQERKREMAAKKAAQQQASAAQPQKYSRDADGGRWVTIGGAEEGDKKHVGGTPVKLGSDGTILAGPPSLEGHKVDAIPKKGDKDSGGESKKERRKREARKTYEESYVPFVTGGGMKPRPFDEWYAWHTEGEEDEPEDEQQPSAEGEPTAEADQQPEPQPEPAAAEPSPVEQASPEMQAETEPAATETQTETVTPEASPQADAAPKDYDRNEAGQVFLNGEWHTPMAEGQRIIDAPKGRKKPTEYGKALAEARRKENERDEARRKAVQGGHASTVRNLDVAGSPHEQTLSQWAEKNGSSVDKIAADDGGRDYEIERDHRAHVMNAVRAGLVVPAEVLADYPDIETNDQIFTRMSKIRETRDVRAYGEALDGLNPAQRRAYLDRSFQESMTARRSKAGTKAAATRKRREEEHAQLISTPQGKRVDDARKKMDELGRRLQYGTPPTEAEWKEAEREIESASRAHNLELTAAKPHVQDIARNENSPALSATEGPEATEAHRDGGIPWRVRHLEGSPYDTISGAEIRDSVTSPGMRDITFYGTEPGTMPGDKGGNGTLSLQFKAGDPAQSKRARKLIAAIAKGKAMNANLYDLQEFVLTGKMPTDSDPEHVERRQERYSLIHAFNTATYRPSRT